MANDKEEYKVSRTHADWGWIVYKENGKYCLYEFDNGPEVLYGVYQTGEEAVTAAMQLT